MIEKSNISRFLLLAFLAILALMSIQGLTGFPKNSKLSGTTARKAMPQSIGEGWFEGSIQSAVAFNIDKGFGFRTPIVRLINELRYRIFSEHNPQVISGKNGYLFERGYRSSVCGKNFLGEELIQLKVDSLEMLRLQLESKGKKLLLLIPPNKWRAHKEFVDWNCRMTKQTNYHVFCEKLYERGFYLFDHQDYFMWEMETSPHPMFSKQGTHWSIYGAATSALSVIASFRSEGIDIPSVSFEDIELDAPRYTDKDLHNLLNIMSYPDPEGDSLAYPILGYTGEKKPRVLVVGDSYYWSYMYLGLHEGLFHPESKYFYYNSTMFIEYAGKGTPITNEMRDAEIEASDVVLLVMCEPSLAKFGFGLLSQEVE